MRFINLLFMYNNKKPEGQISSKQPFKLKIKLRSFKSSEHINEKRDRQNHGFGFLSLVSDPLDLI